MKLNKKIVINKPVADVWKVWAVEFDKASDWMATIPKSVEKTDAPKLEGASMAGRICELSTKPNGPYVDELITKYDNENHLLNVTVVPKNASLPIVQNKLESSLKQLGNDKTEVILDVDIELKTIGKILSPVVKGALAKGFDELLEELKYYVEEGKPHPRKVKKIN